VGREGEVGVLLFDEIRVVYMDSTQAIRVAVGVMWKMHWKDMRSRDEGKMWKRGRRRIWVKASSRLTEIKGEMNRSYRLV